MRRPLNDPHYLAQLRDYHARWHCIPAYDRLCELWGLASRSAAAKVLERLRAQGYLERTPAGDWVPAASFFERPLAGQPVPAGLPVMDAEAGLTPLLLDDYLAVTPSRTLLVPIQGESMVDAGLHDGDLAVVERQAEAAAGDIVVALVDGELTVKRLARDAAGWLLLPENPAFSPLRPQGALTLVGVVVGLTRRLRRRGA